jgi:hypothetical protein
LPILLPKFPIGQPYVYSITIDGLLRYIGKGRGERPRGHFKNARALLNKRVAGTKVRSTRFYNLLAKAVAQDLEVVIEIEALFETDVAAYAHERRLIKRLRQDDYLLNVWDGGIGCSSLDMVRCWQDPVYRKKMIKSAKNKPPCSAETRLKLRLNNLGKRLLEETKRKIGAKE